MSKSKLLPALLIGAAAGAAISMLDRTTREKTVETVKSTTANVKYYVQNRDELKDMIMDKVEEVQGLYEDTSSKIQSFVGDYGDIKDLPGTIQGMLGDTKAAFKREDNDTAQ